ncbi:MAG: iron ABC transporter permease [Eubacteriales bacterium]|nr:iron ABC transporter permease [Eubacteriales bacterium]
MKKGKRLDAWFIVKLAVLALFLLILVYPLFGMLKQSVIASDGNGFTLEYFEKFFSNSYYISAVLNSFKVTLAVTAFSVLIALPLSYFYSFYRIKGARIIFVASLMACMSAPFIGAYAWIMLLGRSGVITQFMKTAFGIAIPNIYGFKGILLVQSLKFFPLIFIYMNGAFRNIDNTLMEASENLGCSGVKRFFTIVMSLSMPTLLAGILLVFMRAFADFGTPMMIGEGYRTFPVEIYTQYVGEVGQNHNFAAAISTIAILITAAIFLLQKWATNRFKFTINALHPVQKKDAKGIKGALMYLYSYALIAVAILPNVYVCYLAFRNSSGPMFKEGYSLDNFRTALDKLLLRAVKNTLLQGVLALGIIILLSILIAYLVVRRSSALSNTIDTLSMLPYIMPGTVIGIALIVAFGAKPWVLTGTTTIMVLNLVIRRMPYTIRSATARLMQIPMSMEEASISLGASKVKTFFRITVPMMASGILSGAVLSWVAIVTELSGAIILYNNKTLNLTMATYTSINRGKYGPACAYAFVLTAITVISMIVYLKLTKSEDDIQL